MDLSVVICTRNRAGYLPKMLASIQKLHYSGIIWELILVDNNSSDDTLSILENFRLNFSVPTQVIHEPKDGLSNARNTGWRAAQGEIVSFTDDDCYPQEDWLTTTVKAFNEYDVAYVGGRVLLFDQDDAPVTIQTSTQPLHFAARAHIESGQIIGANFAFRRKLFADIGGFDTRLGAGTRFHSGEDTDLLTRASKSGFEGRYEPSIVVFHHHRRRLQQDVSKLYRGYAFGRGALFVKMLSESDEKIIPIKGWYWRLSSLIKKRGYTYVANEIKGAVSFILHHKLPFVHKEPSELAKIETRHSKVKDVWLDLPATHQNMKSLFEAPRSHRRPAEEIDKKIISKALEPTQEIV